MSEGEQVKVISTGREGKVIQALDDNRVLVAFPVTRPDGKPGRVIMECCVRNLEVVEGKNEQVEM